MLALLTKFSFANALVAYFALFDIHLVGGRYRIRTRVIGLEGRSDIQTTLIARLSVVSSGI